MAFLKCSKKPIKVRFWPLLQSTPMKKLTKSRNFARNGNFVPQFLGSVHFVDPPSEVREIPHFTRRFAPRFRSEFHGGISSPRPPPIVAGLQFRWKLFGIEAHSSPLIQ